MVFRGEVWADQLSSGESGVTACLPLVGPVLTGREHKD